MQDPSAQESQVRKKLGSRCSISLHCVQIQGLWRSLQAMEENGTQENQVLSRVHGLWIIEAAHKESQRVRQHGSQSQCSSRKSVLCAWIQPISFTGESRTGSEGGIFKVAVQK